MKRPSRQQVLQFFMHGAQWPLLWLQLSWFHLKAHSLWYISLSLGRKTVVYNEGHQRFLVGFPGQVTGHGEPYLCHCLLHSPPLSFHHSSGFHAFSIEHHPPHVIVSSKTSYGIALHCIWAFHFLAIFIIDSICICFSFGQEWQAMYGNYHF